MNRKTMWIVASLVVVLVVVLIYILLNALGAFEPTTPGNGEDAPIVELVFENGGVVHKPVDDFDNLVATAQVPVFVDLWATWCGPCISAAPFVENLADVYQGRLRVVKVDVDRATDVASALRAQSIPYFVLMKDGAKVDQFIGYAISVEADILDMIDSNLD